MIFKIQIIKNIEDYDNQYEHEFPFVKKTITSDLKHLANEKKLFNQFTIYQKPAYDIYERCDCMV